MTACSTSSSSAVASPTSSSKNMTMTTETGESAAPSKDTTAELRKLQERARGRQSFVYRDRKVYSWDQSMEEVNIYVDPPPGVSKHELDIQIKPSHVRMGLKGNPPFIDEDLFSLCDTSCSFWMIEDGELHIQLGKVRKAETWGAVFRAHGRLDAYTEQEVQKKLMLERFGEEHPGFDFSGAEFSGQAPDPRAYEIDEDRTTVNISPTTTKKWGTRTRLSLPTDVRRK
ncbi:unnamed protein product [Amoebophrya sp. A25]|nr:unnamed protein product [Amoebophrya sp. A25]|eukprot:GSA25T00006523001.1